MFPSLVSEIIIGHVTHDNSHPQELVELTMERRMDAYKALVPEIKWVANPVKAQDVVNARRVQLLTHACIAYYMLCAHRLFGMVGFHTWV